MLTGPSMGGMKELAAMRRRQAEFFNEDIGQSASRGPGSDEDSEHEKLKKEEQEGEKEEEVSYWAIAGIAFTD